MYKRKGLGIFLIVLGGFGCGFFFSLLIEYIKLSAAYPKETVFPPWAFLCLLIGGAIILLGINCVRNSVVHNNAIDGAKEYKQRKAFQDAVLDEKLFAETCIRAAIEKQISEKERDHHV